MSIYICDHCNEMKDDDYHPMVESKDSQYVWLCEDCSLEVGWRKKLKKSQALKALRIR
jgi:hypothetical protein